MSKSMTIKSQPKFTAPAARLWARIPVEAQTQLLSNAWCPKCRHEVALADVSGSIKAGQILLVGSCTVCHGKASRTVESVADDSEQAIKILKQEVALIKKRLNELWKKGRDFTPTKEENKEHATLLDEFGEKSLELAAQVRLNPRHGSKRVDTDIWMTQPMATRKSAILNHACFRACCP